MDVDADGLTELIPPATARFFAERIHLLGYLAQDEEWWARINLLRP
jgi:hypothetical protein